MNKYTVVSIEPTRLGNYWVITYQDAKGMTEKETVQALDSHEAFIKFRNQRIEESKAKVILKPQQ